MKDKRHWFIREASRKPSKSKLKFTRKQWKFLDQVKGVDDSLDALFGVVVRHRVRFTERRSDFGS